MKRYIGALILLVFIGCNREFKGDGDNMRKSISVDGVKRSFRIYLPSNYDESKSYPLLIAMHGRYGNSKNMAKSTLFSPLADEYGVIVVYPNGFKKSWNDGRGDGPAAEENIDDVKFIDMLINNLADNYSVNENKVYATGMSNGGFMAMRLACELNHKIAAFSSVTGTFSDQIDCTPDRSVPILLIAGTKDELVPYEGGEVANSGTTALGFQELLDFWATNNDCANFEETQLPETTEDGTQIEILKYSDCMNDKHCMLFKVINGGHTWPSGENFFGSDEVGITSQEINASREILEFSLQYELQ